jgi:hypothetical protein
VVARAGEKRVSSARLPFGGLVVHRWGMRRNDKQQDRQTVNEGSRSSFGGLAVYRWGTQKKINGKTAKR